MLKYLFTWFVIINEAENMRASWTQAEPTYLLVGGAISPGPKLWQHFMWATRRFLHLETLLVTTTIFAWFGSVGGTFHPRLWLPFKQTERRPHNGYCFVVEDKCDWLANAFPGPWHGAHQAVELPASDLPKVQKITLKTALPDFVEFMRSWFGNQRR